MPIAAAMLMATQSGNPPFYVGLYDVLDGDKANPRISLMETFEATAQALHTGDSDLDFTDGTAGNAYFDASCGGLTITGKKLWTEDFGFIFPTGSDFVALINAFHC